MTLRELEKENLRKEIPIIALTADAIVGAKENYIAKGFTDYVSKPVKYERLEQILRQYLPKEKQLSKPGEEEEKSTVLLWGTDPIAVRMEREKLDGIYKCVCVIGEKAKDKYLEKHTPDAVMYIRSSTG